MAKHWHSCQRWFRLGVGCPLHGREGEDEDDGESEEGNAVAGALAVPDVGAVGLPLVNVAGATPLELGVIAAQSIRIIGG